MITFTESDSQTELNDVADDDAATPAETRAAFLARSKSGYTKLRRTFVQEPPTTGGSSRPGMLPNFKNNHRAAVLYLALIANWPWLSREDEPLPAAAWIRFLTCEDPKALTWTPQSLSHAWGVLEDLKLIIRPRKGRLINVMPRREDGMTDYKTPTGSERDSYMTIPNEFWMEEWHGRLSWPALAALLILTKETGLTPTTTLAIDRTMAWYGISRTSAEQGLTELRASGLVRSRDRRVKDVNASEGRRLTSEHTLLGNFSTQSREALRIAAKVRVDRSASIAQRRKEADHEEEPS